MKLLPLTATCSDTLAKDYIISNITTNNNNNNGNKVHNNNLNEYLGTKVHELFIENKCFFPFKMHIKSFFVINDHFDHEFE